MTIPTGALTAGGPVSLSRIPVPLLDWGSAPDGVVSPVGLAIKIDAGGRALASPASISFPVPAEVAATTDPLLVMWQDGQNGWHAVPSETSADRRTVTAQLEHFSIGFLARVDIAASAQWAARQLGAYFGGRSNVAQPTCGGTGTGDAGPFLRVTASDSVKSCVGVQDGRWVLKVANNRRTFTQVTYPKGWQVVDGLSYNVSLDAFARQIHDPVPAGMAARILDGGDTVTLSMPAGTTGTAKADMSRTSWFASAIFFGFEVAGAVETSLLSGAAEKAIPPASGAITRILGFGGGSGWDHALADCTDSLAKELPLSQAATDDEVSEGVVKGTWACIPALMKAYIGETGPVFFGAGVVLAAVTIVVELVLTAMNLIVTGLRDVWDNFVSLRGKTNPEVKLEVITRAVRIDRMCSAVQVAVDLRLPPSDVEVLQCAQGWAYTRNPNELGDTERLARWQIHGWVIVTPFPSSLCVESVAAMGAPSWALKLWQGQVPCSTANPPPTTAADQPCITTSARNAHAVTIRDLQGVTCDQAISRWHGYETFPGPLTGSGGVATFPDGWICQSTSGGTFAATGKLGSCGSQSHSQRFTTWNK